MSITVNAQSSIRIADAKILYFDPFQIQGAPHDADIILITHDHYDHFSPADIKKVMKPDTVLVCPQSMKETAELGLTVKTVSPNESFCVCDTEFRTIPAYNPDKRFHPKSAGWVGYILHSAVYGDVYVAGDTDITYENKTVQCRIAMLPIGGTYTMNAQEAAELANLIRPEIVIPTHYGAVVGKPEDAEVFSAAVGKGIKVTIKIPN